MITSKAITAISYMISVEDLSAIMDKDDEHSPPLYLLLSSIEGVFDIEYDGHFGPHIYLSIEHEHDNQDIWKTIHKTIESYL
jgi:hypothetical protein